MGLVLAAAGSTTRSSLSSQDNNVYLAQSELEEKPYVPCTPKESIHYCWPIAIGVVIAVIMGAVFVIMESYLE